MQSDHERRLRQHCGGQGPDHGDRVPRNQAELDALIAAQQDSSSPQYRQWLTHDEYTRRFGPTEHDFNAVADWLKSSGFQVRTQGANFPKSAILE